MAFASDLNPYRHKTTHYHGLYEGYIWLYVGCYEFSSFQSLPAFFPDILSQQRTINFLCPTYEVVKGGGKSFSAVCLFFLFFLQLSFATDASWLCPLVRQGLSNFHSPNLISKVWQAKGQSVWKTKCLKLSALFFLLLFSLLPISNV